MTCPRCNAPVISAILNSTAKRVLVDEAPSPDGTVLLGGAYATELGPMSLSGIPPTIKRYTLHATTCVKRGRR